MKILLFGGSGQLGYELIARAHDLNFEVVSPVISEIDITDLQQVVRLTEAVKPEMVMNCAAYTAVDKAEEEHDLAFKINCDGAGNVAEGARKAGARMIHISTDYVFDGTHSKPIPEDAATNPINVYGASKLAGEKLVAKTLGDKSLIVRTSSLHGKKGINFVHTMIKLFGEREKLQVVNDQFMSPCWAGWLAEVLLDLSRIGASGILHACCSGVVSWHDFALEILELVGTRLEKKPVLEPIGAAQYARPAKRPSYSALDCTCLSQLLGRSPMPWQEGLRAHLRELGYG